MILKPLYKIITFPFANTKNGILYMFQSHSQKPGNVPFKIKKVLTIMGMQGDDARGAHTHKKTEQVLCCIQGECTVDLEDGYRKKSVVLNKPEEGLLLYPYVWHVMRNFKPNTVLMSLASREYDEKEYVRDYQAFLKHVKRNHDKKERGFIQ